LITQRAWLVGVVGFCFYLIAIVNTLPAFYQALTWLSFGVLASSLAVAFLSLIGLRAAWRVPHAVVTESIGQSEDGPIVEVQMSNVGTLNKTGILIDVHLERISVTGEKSPNLQLTRRFLMEALPSGNSLQTALPLLHLPRGRYRVLELKLIGSDTLGLFRIQKRVPPNVSFAGVLDTQKRSIQKSSAKKGEQSTPAVVKPADISNEIFKTSEIVIGAAALARHDISLSPVLIARGDGGVPATRFLGQGEDVRGTRLYAAGDDLRRVHWKSTARKGQLVVKEFHHTVQEHVLVVWDGAAQTRWGELREGERTTETIWRDAVSVGGFNSEEWSLRVAASLCRALLENRRPCALLRLDKSPYGAGLVSGAQISTAQYSALTMQQVSETLADAQANRETVLQKALQPFQAGRQAGEVYFVTASLSPEVSRALAKWRGQGTQVVVALVNGAAFLDSASGLTSSSANSARRSTPARRKRAAAPTQSWQDDSETVHQMEVTEENYQQQARALRAAGARVVLIAPRDGTRDFFGPLNAALQELFDQGASAETLHSLENRASQNNVSPNRAAPDWSTPAQASAKASNQSPLSL